MRRLALACAAVAALLVAAPASAGIRWEGPLSYGADGYPTDPDLRLSMLVGNGFWVNRGLRPCQPLYGRVWLFRNTTRVNPASMLSAPTGCTGSQSLGIEHDLHDRNRANRASRDPKLRRKAKLKLCTMVARTSTGTSPHGATGRTPRTRRTPTTAPTRRACSCCRSTTPRRPPPSAGRGSRGRRPFA
jgi:hypothetical protein